MCQVYAWGDNDEGQCGNGKTNAVPTPQLIDSLQVCLLFFAYRLAIASFHKFLDMFQPDEYSLKNDS